MNLGPRSTHIDKKSPFVISHHRNWRLKALETADKLDDDEIMYTAPMCVSKDVYKNLQTSILKLIEGFVSEATESKSDELYYLNIDLRKMRTE